MIGTGAENPADLHAAHDGEVEVENDQIWRPVRHRLERGITGSDDLGVGLSTALQRVLDEPGDVLLVFDDEDAMFGHPCVSGYRPKISRLCLNC